MGYGPGFGNNLPPWKPMAMQTPPLPATSTAAPGPISNYSASQLRMLNHSEPAPMPAGGAARPPVSRQAPINSSVGQMTPRSAGLGGSVSPRTDSLSKFDNFLRQNTAFQPQATVNTPGLVEGMANTPRSMGVLESPIQPSAAHSFLASGGVLPPEPPKPVVDMSVMRGNPQSTVGYSMGGSAQTRSPGAPFSVPPSSGGGGYVPPDPGALAGAAGALGGAGKFLTGGSIGGTLARSPILYAAGSAAKQAYEAASDVYNDRPNATLQASIPYRRATYDNINSGNYGAAAVNAARAMGATGYEVGKNMLSPFSNFLGQAYNEMKGPAVAAPAPTPPAAPPAVQPPAATPPAAAPSAPGRQPSLSEQYPGRFKGVPSFRDVVAGGGDSRKIPLTAQEQNYNAEVLRGMQLENRSRELANVDRYRATQLHDRNALATLAASDGRGLGQGLEREQFDPEGKNDALQKGVSMLDERRNAVRRALFDQSEPSIPNRIANATNAHGSLEDLRALLKMDPQTFAEYVKANYGRTYDPKSGYFKADR